MSNKIKILREVKGLRTAHYIGYENVKARAKHYCSSSGCKKSGIKWEGKWIKPYIEVGDSYFKVFIGWGKIENNEGTYSHDKFCSYDCLNKGIKKKVKGIRKDEEEGKELLDIIDKLRELSK